MSLEMIGPVSARGDKEFGKAYLERAMPLQKTDLKLIWGHGHKATSYRTPKKMLEVSDAQRANRAAAQVSGRPKSDMGREISRYNRQGAKVEADPVPHSLYYSHRLTDPHHYSDFQWQGEGSRRGVSKIYREQATAPTKAVIRRIQGGVNWRSSRPEQIIATEAQESHQRSALKAGIKPRFPRSKEKAAWNSQTGQYLNPENVRYGWHQTHAREIYDYQPGKRRVSKTFIPGAGKVTPDKGYVPAAIPATQLAAPARARRADVLRQKQSLRSIRRTFSQSSRRGRLPVSMDRKGAIPLPDRGKRVNTKSPGHAKMRELNQTPTTPSSTHKKVSYGPGITPDRQKQIDAALPKKVRRPVVFHHAAQHGGMEGNTAAVTYARTGTTKPSHVILGPDAEKVHIRHEFEHSQPRRSYDRVARVNQTEHGTGREEGRADVGAIRATGLQHRAQTLYEQHSEMNRAANRGNQVAAAAFRNASGSKEFVRGYDEVRAKMGMKPRGARTVLPQSMHMAIRGADAARAATDAVRQVGVAGRRVRRLFGKADVEKKGGVSFALGRTIKPRGAGLSHPYAPFQSRLHYGGRTSPDVPKSERVQLKPTGNSRQLETQVNPPARRSFTLGKPFQAEYQKPLLGPKASGGEVTTDFNPYKLNQVKTIRAGRTARMRSRGEKPGLSGMGNFSVGKMFDWELGDIHAEQRLRERASGKPQPDYDRYGNEKVYRAVKPKPKPEVPTAKATGLRAIEAPKKPLAISARMAPKPAANIRLVHSRPPQIGDMPRLKLPDYMRHLKVVKVDTTMSDADAKRLATQYDTRGPLPKQLNRDQRMKAYEARYIASGGKEGEKWQRRANAAEISRNVGLAGATAGAALTLAGRNKRLAPHLKKVGITHHRADNAALGAAAYGGASELYGEHARSKRASFRNSPAGVAGSALSRMQAYTPEKKKP